MRKWLSRKIRNYASDLALDFTTRWGECRFMMEESVRKDEGMLKYGMLGLASSVMMLYAVLGNVLELGVFLLKLCAALFAFLLWLCFFIVHPLYTTMTTIVVAVPFSFGCIYCSKMRNEVEKNDNDR